MRNIVSCCVFSLRSLKIDLRHKHAEPKAPAVRKPEDSEVCGEGNKRTPIIQTDLTCGHRCCAQMVWLATVTRKWSMKGGPSSPSATEVSEGKAKTDTVSLERMISPGDSIAMEVVIPSATKVEQHPGGGGRAEGLAPVSDWDLVSTTRPQQDLVPVTLFWCGFFRYWGILVVAQFWMNRAKKIILETTADPQKGQRQDMEASFRFAF